MSRGTSLFYTIAEKDVNPILPGYVPGTFGQTSSWIIPANGWLRISLTAMQDASETRSAKIRCAYTNSLLTLSVINANPDSLSADCNFVPVNAGESVCLCCLEEDNSDINASKSWIGLTFYPLLPL